MRIAGIAAFVCLVLATSTIAAAEPFVYGFGNVTCDTYLGFQRENQSLYEGAKTWTTGYLTAMGQELKIADLLAGSDMNDAAAWLTSYCSQHRDDKFSAANGQLVNFLTRSRLMTSKVE
jgi:hypothetical protein